MAKFRFIDLFAGIGGLRIPFDEIGGQCVFTSEIDLFAQQTYKANFNEQPSGDITKIDPKDIPTHDLLLAGFPCQSFSDAGRKLGFDDKRGQMFFYIRDILDYHRPSVVLLENVKGLIKHDKGETLSYIIQLLEQLDYKVCYKILNAKDFNLPQSRERVYIVALQNKDVVFEYPEGVPLSKSLVDILEETVDEKYTLSDKLWNWFEDRRKSNCGFLCILINSNTKYARTIMTRVVNGTPNLVEQTGKNPRRLTPREYARLQGFSDTYKIEVSDTQAYKQFGNSVAIPVVRAIANNLKHILNLV